MALLLLLFLTSLLHFSSGSSPTITHFLDCGATVSTPADVDDHRVFVPDSSFLRLLSGSEVSVSDSEDRHPSLYRTARIFTRAASYRFDIKQRGTYLVRLHFYAFRTGSRDLSRGRFHVLSSGSVLLSDFRVVAGEKTTPFERGCGFHMMKSDEIKSPYVLKEYFLWVDSDELEITFVPFGESSFAFVNAIEVISAPGLVPDIVYTVAPGGVEKLSGVSKQEFEVLFRINTGGSKLTPFNDTMWRHWVPDGEFLTSSSVSETVHFSGRIQYQKYGASPQIAPYNVYSSARVLKLAKLPAPGSNMTWSFSVPHGYKYLVRLHFADIASLALNELYFNVYINGYTAYEDFDLSKSADWVLAAPYYLDFVIEPDMTGLLTVTITPSNFSSPSKVNGLLNGAEIMKLSDSMGMMLSSRGTRSFLRMFLCGSAFVALMVAGFMMLSRWRTASKVSAGWSPLPMVDSEGKLNFGNQMASGKSVQF